MMLRLSVILLNDTRSKNETYTSETFKSFRKVADNGIALLG